MGGGGEVSVFKSKIPPFYEENTKDTKQDVKWNLSYFQKAIIP